jgi:hypothetical protein
MHREAWCIRQIAASDFIGNELQSMRPEDKMLWLTLLDKHLRSIDQELTSLNGDLAPLLLEEKTGLPASQSTLHSLRNADELGAVAVTLNQDAKRLDVLLIAGLTLSPQTPPTQNNSEPVVPLLSALRTNEATLHRTIEHLQVFGKPETAK